MKEDKKAKQLGMNPSTASGRLVKDILWDLIVKTDQHFCCKCQKEMTRQTFSIEHLVPWLDSENPLSLYFDLENISFSHLSCNVADNRGGPKRKIYENERERVLARQARRKGNRKYDPEKRRQQYLTKGT